MHCRNHIICNSVIGVDTGFDDWFLIHLSMERKIYEIFEEICGARLTTNIGRIGGFDMNGVKLLGIKSTNFFKEFPKGLKKSFF